MADQERNQPKTEPGNIEDEGTRLDVDQSIDRDTSVNFVVTGDETAWDAGRESSIGHGTHAENDVYAADAETPGVRTKKEDPEERGC